MKQKYIFQFSVYVQVGELLAKNIDSYIAAHMNQFDAADGFSWAEHRSYLRAHYLRQVELLGHLLENSDYFAKFIRPAVECELRARIDSDSSSLGDAMREIAAAMNKTEHFFPGHLGDLG